MMTTTTLRKLLSGTAYIKLLLAVA